MNGFTNKIKKKSQLRRYFSNTTAMDAGNKSNGPRKMARLVCFPQVTHLTITAGGRVLAKMGHWSDIARYSCALIALHVCVF